MAEHETEIALGIVLDGANVLIIERQQREIGRNGEPIVWAFPGGKLEDDETAMAAAEREVAEETGYHVEAVETITAESHPQYPVYAHYIACKLLGKSALAELPDVIVHATWAPADSLERLFTWPMNEQVKQYIRNHALQ